MIFNDCFYSSKNNRGFFQIFSEIDDVKLVDLIGEHTEDDVKKLDMYARASIGFLRASPLLSSIFDYVSSDTELTKRQNDAVNMFIYFKYVNLLKVKKLFLLELSENNGYIKNENVSISKEDIDTISAFNSGEDFENDKKNSLDTMTNRQITRKDTNTSRTISNISELTDFYKMQFYDKIIDFMKDLFTLQVVD